MKPSPGLMGGDAPWREEVGGGDPAQRAPIGAVGCEPDGASEHEALSGLFYGTVCEVG